MGSPILLSLRGVTPTWVAEPGETLDGDQPTGCRASMMLAYPDTLP